jgi:hypothetical protein
VASQSIRTQAIKAIGNRESPQRIAKAFGVIVRLVYRWVAPLWRGLPSGAATHSADQHIEDEPADSAFALRINARVRSTGHLLR